MQNKKTKDLVIQNIYLLIPLIMYGIYKNGYLLYEKKLVSAFGIIKPLYLITISVCIKIIIDLVTTRKIKIDYDLLYSILVGMIMPYNVNLIIYSLGFAVLYIVSGFLSKIVKFNKVCFIYLVIILINFLFNQFTFKSPLELNYDFNFTFFDLLMGRNVGGISSTSIFFALISYIFLITSFYYKKDIPLTINVVYLMLTLIYFIISGRSDFLLNNDLIFASIFIVPLPEYSPYKRKNQIIFSLIISICTFLLAIYFNKVISVYLATFVISLCLNIKTKQKEVK